MRKVTSALIVVAIACRAARAVSAGDRADQQLIGIRIDNRLLVLKPAPEAIVVELNQRAIGRRGTQKSRRTDQRTSSQND